MVIYVTTFHPPKYHQVDSRAEQSIPKMVFGFACSTGEVTNRYCFHFSLFQEYQSWQKAVHPFEKVDFLCHLSSKYFQWTASVGDPITGDSVSHCIGN